MTTTNHLTEQPVKLPKFGSWPQAVHIFNKDSINALQAAAAAQRPLLIRGEPGTGKSQLARAAAVVSKRLFLSVVVNASTECHDLQWQFDAVGRLGEAQTLAHISDPEAIKRLQAKHFLSPGPLWWAFDWNSAQLQWNECSNPLSAVPEHPDGWQPSVGCVLLIDEIDKADTDLPNGLLETLGNGDFSLPYLGQTVRQAADCPPPLVIITTNEERELPAAFLRRCAVLHLDLPKPKNELIEFLCKRGHVHCGDDCSEDVYRKAAEQLVEDRERANKLGLPLPGQAEYLDLMRALRKMAAKNEEKQLELLNSISKFMLKKSSELLKPDHEQTRAD